MKKQVIVSKFVKYFKGKLKQEPYPIIHRTVKNPAISNVDSSKYIQKNK